MVFKDRFVVVEECEAGAGLDVEVVGGAGMIVVVDDGGEENTEYLQVRQPGLKSSIGQARARMEDWITLRPAWEMNQ